MDWKKIKTEYITGDVSYRKLAEMYGVTFSALEKRARKEKWYQQKKEFCDKTVTEAVEAISNERVENAVKLSNVTEKLLDRISNEIDNAVLSAQNIKQLTGSLKDIRDILIDNSTNTGEIKIVFEGNTEDYSK